MHNYCRVLVCCITQFAIFITEFFVNLSQSHHTLYREFVPLHVLIVIINCAIVVILTRYGTI